MKIPHNLTGQFPMDFPLSPLLGLRSISNTVCGLLTRKLRTVTMIDETPLHPPPPKHFNHWKQVHRSDRILMSATQCEDSLCGWTQEGEGVLLISELQIGRVRHGSR